MRFYSLWLSLICIIMFILQVSFGITETLVLNQSSFIEPWRFVTSIFLHGDLSHLIYNMFALILFGLILEKLIGNRFLYVFFLSGIVANIFSVFFYESSLGASGAIFGIIGCLAVLKPGMAVWVYSLPMPLWLASILWVVGDIMGLFMPSNVANLAHLSGIFVGMIFGVFFRQKTEKRNIYKIKLDERQIRNWEDRFMR